MNFFRKLWAGLKRHLTLSLPSKPIEPVEEAAVEEIEEPVSDSQSEPAPAGDVGQLTENFHVSEFKCKDGTDVPEEYLGNVKKLCENLQILRDRLGKAIYINSGYRTPDYNARIGGAKNSQHMYAKAADIKVKGYGSERLAGIIMEMIDEGTLDKGGVGIYPTFVHYDTRGRNARWRGTRKKN